MPFFLKTMNVTLKECPKDEATEDIMCAYEIAQNTCKVLNLKFSSHDIFTNVYQYID